MINQVGLHSGLRSSASITISSVRVAKKCQSQMLRCSHSQQKMRAKYSTSVRRILNTKKKQMNTGSRHLLSFRTCGPESPSYLNYCDLCTLSCKPDHWETPKGFDTGISCYHPFTKEKVPLILQQHKLIKWYACGPTVYDSAHLGHASSYVRLDIIRRIFKNIFDIDTVFALGMTDIDDKIIKRAIEEKVPFEKITQHYESEFFSDMEKLNVMPPDTVLRVTEYIHNILSFITKLEGKDVAYKASDGSVYFDIKKYGSYGAFGKNKENLTDDKDSVKRNVEDFALWKSIKPGEPSWPSPWGPGRPGWHIECSAMASSLFGSRIDVHSGGMDLMFPHHENELAQSQCFHSSSQWVNYWFHTGHLFVSGDASKMSKSLKNGISVSELLEDYSSNCFRMLCLLSSYRKDIEYNEMRLMKAEATLKSFDSAVSRCAAYAKGYGSDADIPEAELYERLHTAREVTHTALADDFNTPKALAEIMRLVKFTNQCIKESVDEPTQPIGREISNVRSTAPVAAVGIYVKKFMEQLGLEMEGKMRDATETGSDLNEAVETVVSARSKIRQHARDKDFVVKTAGEFGVAEKDAKKMMKKLYSPLWQISDEMRSEALQSMGVEITDKASGSTWSFVDNKKKLKEPAGSKESVQQSASDTVKS